MLLLFHRILRMLGENQLKSMRHCHMILGVVQISVNQAKNS